MKLKNKAVFGIVVGLIMITAGCMVDDESDGPGNGGSLYVFETDFTTGQLERFNTEKGTVTLQDIPVYSDAVLQTYNGYLYILERMGADNIMKIDPSESDQNAVMYQVKLGDGWNPCDIAFVSNRKAYVVNQNEPEITVFDPENAKVTGHIFIDKYTFMPDSNTTPYANAAVVVNKKLYVALQRRNGFRPGAPTMILPIDIESNVIDEKDTVVCTYTNNYDMIAVDGVLYCTNAGNIGVTGDGGIERIDCATGMVETVMTEDDLGGDPNQILYKYGDRFYVQVYVGWQDVKVVEIDVATKEIVKTLSNVDDAWGGICYDTDGDKLYVGERDTSGIGIKVFDDNRKASGPHKSGSTLPPSNLIFVENRE